MVVGRCANRVQGASFTLDGKTFELAANNGKHALHGGVKGFDKHFWSAQSITHLEGDAVVLKRTSPDGEEVCMHAHVSRIHCVLIHATHLLSPRDLCPEPAQALKHI